MTATLVLTRYYQSAFTLRLQDYLVAFDFGSEMTPALVTSIGRPSAVFVSHKHPDHFNSDALRILAAPINAPMDVVADLRESDLTVTPISPGSETHVGPFSVLAVHSDHGPNISAPIENLAFLVRGGGKTLAYLGDMAVPTPFAPGPYDAFLVPVGGSKVFTPEAALAFVNAQGEGVRLVVPVHYHGRADRQSGLRFKELDAGRHDVRILEVGEHLVLA